MNGQEIQRAFLDALVYVAPETAPESLVLDEPLRDQLDLDSMDVLNVMIRLNEVLGVDVPERDYDRFETIVDAVAYLEDAVGKQAKGALP